MFTNPTPTKICNLPVEYYYRRNGPCSLRVRYISMGVYPGGTMPTTRFNPLTFSPPFTRDYFMLLIGPSSQSKRGSRVTICETIFNCCKPRRATYRLLYILPRTSPLQTSEDYGGLIYLIYATKLLSEYLDDP